MGQFLGKGLAKGPDMEVPPERNRILRWERSGPLPRRGREAGHCACVEPPRQFPGPAHLSPCSSLPHMSGGRWRNERTLATELRDPTAQTHWPLGPSIPASPGASPDEDASARGPHPKCWHCIGAVMDSPQSQLTPLQAYLPHLRIQL